MGILLAIIGLVAAGVFVAYAVIMTLRWVVNKVKRKLEQKNAKKVAVGDLNELIMEAVEQNDNRVKVDDLEEMMNKGYSHYMATVDNEGQIIDEVELIKDKNENLDAEVEKLLGHKGLVVIEG